MSNTSYVSAADLAAALEDRPTILDLDAFWLIVNGQVGKLLARGSCAASLTPFVCSLYDASRLHAPGGRFRASSARQVSDPPTHAPSLPF